MSKRTVQFKNISQNSVELVIEGEIVQNEWYAWSYPYCAKDEFCKELEKHDGKKLTIYIDSQGGDVAAASVIYTALIERKGETEIRIDGECYSAASVIAMAGKVYMSPTALMMIHNPKTMAWGESKDFDKAVKVLEECKEGLINAYELKTKLPREEIARLMDLETFMSSRHAISLGFADEEIGTMTEEEKQQVRVAQWYARKGMTKPKDTQPQLKLVDKQIQNQQSINDITIFLRSI